MTEYYNMNYGGKEVQVESAVRDEEGYSIKGCYAKKTEIKNGTLTINTQGGSTLGTFSANQSTNQTVTLPNGSVQLLDQSVTFVSDNTYEEFPYRASVTVSGISSSTYAEVTYSEEQATSLNFATFCDTATDVIYLYSRTNVGTVMIPTISIGMDYSDITIDSTPTSGSGNAVSSGGVYTALTDGSVSKLGTSTIGTDTKPVKWVNGVPTAVTNDLVDVATAQDVTANKSFLNNSAYSSGDKYSPFLYFKTDNSSNILGGITAKRSGTTSGNIYLEIHNPNTNDWKGALSLNTDGTNVWTTTNYRVYSSAGDSDVLTKGMMKDLLFYKSGETITLTNWRAYGPGMMDWNGVGGQFIMYVNKIIPSGLSVKFTCPTLRVLGPNGMFDYALSNASCEIIGGGMILVPINNPDSSGTGWGNAPVVVRSGTNSAATITFS